MSSKSSKINDEEQPALGTPEPPKKPISVWWPLSFGALTVVCAIAGFVILSSYISNESTGSLFGAIALLVIGVICKIIALILLFVRRSQIKRKQPPPPIQPPSEDKHTAELSPETHTRTEFPGSAPTTELLSTPIHELSQPPAELSPGGPVIPPQELQAAVPARCTNCNTFVGPDGCSTCGFYIR